MIDRIQISALIAVPLVSVAISLKIAGEPLSWIWVESFGIAVSVTVVVLTLFDRLLWRLPILQNWFVKRPILVGKWEFVITSLWTDPSTKLSPEPIKATAIIRQTYTQLHLRLCTPESSGDFYSSEIVRKKDGTYQICGVYRNQPSISVQDSSRPHLGALVLEVICDLTSPEKLEGHYWTDRNTRGEISGTRK